VHWWRCAAEKCLAYDRGASVNGNGQKSLPAGVAASMFDFLRGEKSETKKHAIRAVQRCNITLFKVKTQ